MTLEQSIRFDLLDGLRGLAAIAVMAFHFTLAKELYWVKGSVIFIDMFFMLSGFMLAHRYGPDLLAGMSFRQFMLHRLSRLGPLYYLALLLGLIAALLAMNAGEFPSVTPKQFGTALVLGAVWLPYQNNVAWWILDGRPLLMSNFPFNGPSWTMFFEAFTCIMFFFYVQRFKKLSGILLVSVALVMHIFIAYWFQQFNAGSDWNFHFGFPRFVADFFAGALFYQMGLHKRPAKPWLALFVSVIIVLVVFGVGGDWVAFVCSITLIPWIIVLAAAIPLQSRGLIRTCTLLGNLSYPLYIVHLPIHQLLWQIPPIRSMSSPILQSSLLCCICLVIVIGLTNLDMRLRKILTARIASLGARTGFS